MQEVPIKDISLRHCHLRFPVAHFPWYQDSKLHMAQVMSLRMGMFREDSAKMDIDQGIRGKIDQMFDDVMHRRRDRRGFMKDALAIGGAAGVAYAFPMIAGAQSASPEAASIPGLSAEDYDGELADDQVMRIPMTEPDNMDPGVSTGYDEIGIFFNIFDGLTGIDQKTNEVVPRMAESWETNDDASEYTFTLVQNGMWSDGTAITANDFVYAWRRVLDPDTMSLYTGAMHPIKNGAAIEAGEMDLEDLGVEAVDDYTLKVTMEGPTTFFPLLASTWTFSPVPKHVIDDKAEAWVEAENIVSNGPYKMTEWAHDQKITLELNEHYYGEVPTITRGEYTIMADTTTQAYVAFENNEVDYANPEGTELDRVLADEEALKLITMFEQSNCRFLTCDTTNAPTDNVDFRHALSAAIDRETLANVILKGQSSPAYNMLPHTIAGSNPDAVLPDGPEAAAEALTASGVDAASTEIELSYPSSPERYRLVAEYLQARWQEVLGITIKMNPVEPAAWSDYKQSRIEQPYHLTFGTWGSDFSDASNWHNQNFVSTSDHYQTKWVNEEYDALCAAAVINTDPDERAQQYQEAEALLIEGAPLIPMYRGKVFVAKQDWVKSLFMQPILAYVHLRYIKIAPH